MGCSGSSSVDVDPNKEKDLEEYKRQLMMDIEVNNAKINSYNNEIENYNKLIREGENQLKLNAFSLSKEEQEIKFQKLVELKNDRARAQRQLNSLKPLNETTKNNLEDVKKRIEKLRLVKTVKTGEILRDRLGDEENNSLFKNNQKRLVNQKTLDEQNIRELDRLNRQYNGNDGVDEERYRMELLGGTKP